MPIRIGKSRLYSSAKGRTSEESLLPLGAILAGRHRLELGEVHRPAPVVALLLFTLLRAFHGNLFGGFSS